MGLKKISNTITHSKYESKNMAMNLNRHVFKGHRTLLGSKFVTYGEVELPIKYELFQKSSGGFDWGNGGDSAAQLSFSILHQLTDKNLAREYATLFTNDVIKTLNSRDWVLSAVDVLEWIDENCEQNFTKEDENQEIERLIPIKSSKKSKKSKTNVVKEICKELNITQKNLAEILEVPEGTVSSWAVKNDIPRLGKKAIEFYIQNTRNQKIVDSYRSFMQLLNAS